MFTFLPYIGLFGPISLCLAGICGTLLSKRHLFPKDRDVAYERKVS